MNSTQNWPCISDKSTGGNYGNSIIHRQNQTIFLFQNLIIISNITIYQFCFMILYGVILFLLLLFLELASPGVWYGDGQLYKFDKQINNPGELFIRLKYQIHYIHYSDYHCLEIFHMSISFLFNGFNKFMCTISWVLFSQLFLSIFFNLIVEWITFSGGLIIIPACSYNIIKGLWNHSVWSARHLIYSAEMFQSFSDYLSAEGLGVVE